MPIGNRVSILPRTGSIVFDFFSSTQLTLVQNLSFGKSLHLHNYQLSVLNGMTVSRLPVKK